MKWRSPYQDKSSQVLSIFPSSIRQPNGLTTAHGIIHTRTRAHTHTNTHASAHCSHSHSTSSSVRQRPTTTTTTTTAASTLSPSFCVHHHFVIAAFVLLFEKDRFAIYLHFITAIIYSGTHATCWIRYRVQPVSRCRRYSWMYADKGTQSQAYLYSDPSTPFHYPARPPRGSEFLSRTMDVIGLGHGTFGPV